MIEINFVKLYESSFKDNWNLDALTDINDTNHFTYGEMAKQIARMHMLFEHMDINKGDKIALVGPNHSSWAIVFMATITYGAVIVPILRDFHPSSIENIILHSDSKISFIDESIWKNINKHRVTPTVFNLIDFQIIHEVKNKSQNIQAKIDQEFSSKYPKGFNSNDINYPDIKNDSIMCLNYISGSENFLRGVILTGNNYAGNVLSLRKLNFILKGEKIVVFLPMAHAFGCTLDLLYSLAMGGHLHILSKITNAKSLLNAFQQVKPTLIGTVPQILEVIVGREKEQAFLKPFNKIMLKMPLLKRIVYRRIRKSLVSIFGDNHREMLVGGATLNGDVEDFLIKIKFPFSVAYGMTECAPTISVDKHNLFVPRSCGTIVEDFMKARINSNDPENIPGEIEVKGTNVMKGYYKKPIATSLAFTEDGWFKTGDLGVLDKQNRLYIKGLVKTMILGSNGQNIYQKEIETQLNKMDLVQESLVIMRNNGLIALVYPNYKEIKEKELTSSDLDKIMKNNRRDLNKMLARYEKIGKIELIESEFEKTIENKIKRELYV